MPPPKPKPRKQLAEAAAVASKWAFGTKDLDEKQLDAALRNYRYIEKRLRETGGQLTDVERGIGERHEARRATLPPPVVARPDVQDYAAGAQRGNLARGAAKTGGMGQPERQRALKALKAPPKRRGAAILKELERQGFSPPQDEKQAQAQARQLIKSLSGSQQAATREAMQQPLDVRRNAKLIGQSEAQRLARATRKAMPPPPKPDWADKAAGGLGWVKGKAAGPVDWVVPERAERALDEAEKQTAGIAPDFLDAPVQNLKQITGDIAMALPVIGETVYNDFTGKTQWGIPKMLKEGLVEWGKGIERATPLPKDLRATIDHLQRGEFGEIKDEAWQDLKDMRDEWTKKPFTALLNVYPGVSAGYRTVEFPTLVRRIARANPSMSKAAVLRAARKESYVPGYGARKGKYKGGIPDRLLTGKIVSDEGEVLGTFKAPARPPSRSAAGRALQNKYDRWSRSEGVLAPGRLPLTKRFSELHRAARARQRKNTLESERIRTKLIQQTAPIEKYIRQSGLGTPVKNVLLGRLAENRARISETFYGPQGPSGIDVTETLKAVSNDLKSIAREGGQEIPTDKKLDIDKELRRIDIRLENQGPTVRFGTGLWADAANLMRDAGYTQEQIEVNLELAAGAARAWAKREPGRDPNDWLGSPEGRDITGFEFGTPPPEALGQSLFQVLYPGDKDIKEVEGNPYRENRIAYDAQWESFQAAKAAGEVPRNAPFRFDPPHKTAYNLTPDSEKSRIQRMASEALDRTTDVRTGEMLPGADPLEYERVAKALPREAEQRARTDGRGESHVGRTTLDQKEGALKGFYNTLDPDGQELFARWYERVWDYVAYLYGDDVMREMGDAFFASQAAQSPAGGIANLFRVAEKVKRGETLDPKAGFIQANIWKLMTRQNLGADPKGLAAKLMDFMDSGLGFNMRTIMQGLSKVGPGVVDRWTWRSDGYYPKFDSKEGGMVSRNLEGGIEPDAFLGTERGQAIAYEYSSKRLQLLTNRLNQQGFGGRRDWTVDQVQALDWFATKKRWVEEGFTPKSAEGGSPLDMALDNTREFVFHGSPAELRRIAKQTGAGVRIVSGVNETGEGIQFSTSPEGVTHAIVAGAGGSLDRFRQALGERGHTVAMRYPGSMGGTATQRSHQFDISRERRGEASEAIRRAKLKDAEHPNLYSMGDRVYRLDFGHGKRGLERARAVAKELGIDEAEIQARFTESAGTPRDVLYDYRRMEKAIKTAERERMKANKGKGRERGPTEEDMIETLESLKERLGLREGDTPTDDQILDLANQLVGESRGRPEVLHQRRSEGIAGAVQFLDTESGRQLIYLSEHANPSTFVHELFGHAAHEMKRELPTEFAAVEKRYGKVLEDWGEAEHERFAREAERYFMTGKAPIPELQPVFDRMRGWMRAVYETIKALGRPINPETQRLLDRYFGKEPLDFTPPKRLRRGLPSPGDTAAVATLVDETADLLMHGPDVLRNDPARRLRIGGNMKWLEQQVLPYVDQQDPALAARVHDLFDQFNEVKSGSSIFNADERLLLAARGKLLRQRHAQLDKMADSLRAQPDRVLLDMARDVMDDADNAETLEDVQAMLKDLKAVSGETRRRTQYDMEIQRQLERQVKDLERALDPDRKVNKGKRDEALGAMREISAQMTDIYLDIFGEGLGPEALEMLKRSLAVRDNVIPTRLRELGLLDEGTGEGVYVPHYSIFSKLFSTYRGPVRLPAAGANRKQLSMKVRAGQETFGKGANKLKRYGTGTLQADPRALLSAYRNRLRFVETSLLRRQLYEIGVEIPRGPDGNPRIPEGWYILNGTGEAVPERLKSLAQKSQREIDEMLAAGEDVDSLLDTEAGTLKMLEEYKNAWMRKSENGDVPGEWDSDKLRMLPPEVVETMIGKVFEATPGGFLQSVGGLLSVAGRVATIFSHPIGYLQANAVANGMLLALTQPTRAPRAIMEFFKTPMSLRRTDPTLYEDITVQTGDVQTEAGLPGFYVKEQTGTEYAERVATAGAKKWASFLGDLADQPFRVASWTGHARKEGYTTPEQWRDLLDSADPAVVRAREIVSQRTREDMLDFNKLSPQEQRLARFLFIWPFIRAATAQPVWLMREYPGRMAALATAAQAQEQAYEDIEGGYPWQDGRPTDIKAMRTKYNEVAPAGERTMFDIGEVPFMGGTVNMGQVNPVGPFSEKAVAAANIIRDPTQLGPAGDLVNPAFSTILEGLYGRGMDWERVAESTIPGAKYLTAAMVPKARGAQKYTDRNSFWDWFRRRQGRFFPEDVDPEEIREAGKEEAEKLDKRPAWEKAHEEDMESYDRIVAAAVKKGKRPPTPEEEAAIKKSITAYNAFDQAEDALKDETGKTDLDEYDKIKATYAVAYEYYPEKAKTLPPLEDVLTWPEKSRKENVNDVYTLRMDIRRKIQGKRSKLMSRGRDLGAVE